jgi:hypothetical protein
MEISLGHGNSTTNKVAVNFLLSLARRANDAHRAVSVIGPSPTSSEVGFPASI